MISLAPLLELDDDHRYTYRGKPVISVTQVLKEEGLIDARFFPKDMSAAKRGTIVHRLAELDVEGDLYEADIPEAFQGYLAAVRAWRRDVGWTTARDERGRPFAEVRMFDPVLIVAGTADEIGMSRGQTGLTLVDLKTGVPAPATSLQTAAYAWMFHLATGRIITRRSAVELRDDGTYRLHHYTDVTDLETFKSALRVRRWRAAHIPALAESRAKETAAA